MRSAVHIHGSRSMVIRSTSNIILALTPCACGRGYPSCIVASLIHSKRANTAKQKQGARITHIVKWEPSVEFDMIVL